jgi:threonine/homoserine/homoserine lactone efflux protein
VTQGIRLACLLLAVLLPVPTAWKIALIVGSVVLPWFGVVAANGGPARERSSGAALVPRAEPMSRPAISGIVVDATPDDA